jgi:hypothetical protein
VARASEPAAEVCRPSWAPRRLASCLDAGLLDEVLMFVAPVMLRVWLGFWERPGGAPLVLTGWPDLHMDPVRTHRQMDAFAPCDTPVDCRIYPRDSVGERREKAMQLLSLSKLAVNIALILAVSLIQSEAVSGANSVSEGSSDFEVVPTGLPSGQRAAIYDPKAQTLWVLTRVDADNSVLLTSIAGRDRSLRTVELSQQARTGRLAPSRCTAPRYGRRGARTWWHSLRKAGMFVTCRFRGKAARTACRVGSLR